MPKHARSEAVRKLRELIAVTTDPKLLIDLTRQLNNLLPTAKQAKRRPRKVEAAPPSSKKSSILDRVTGSAVDNLSDGKKVVHYLVVELEKSRKKSGSAEWNAAKQELIASLSERERAALEALDTGEVS